MSLLKLGIWEDAIRTLVNKRVVEEFQLVGLWFVGYFCAWVGKFTKFLNINHTERRQKQRIERGGEPLWTW